MLQKSLKLWAATLNKGFVLLLAIYLDSDDSNQGEDLD